MVGPLFRQMWLMSETGEGEVGVPAGEELDSRGGLEGRTDGDHSWPGVALWVLPCLPVPTQRTGLQSGRGTWEPSHLLRFR